MLLPHELLYNGGYKETRLVCETCGISTPASARAHITAWAHLAFGCPTDNRRDARLKHEAGLGVIVAVL